MSPETVEQEHTFITNMTPGSVVLQLFQLRSKDLRKTRTGQEYLDLLLGDHSGDISAKMWSDAIRKWGLDFDPGDIVKIEGRVDSYRERNQIVVDKIRRVEITEVPDLSVLVKSSSQDPNALFEDLKLKADNLNPPELARLVVALLDKHEAEWKTRPAAKMVHHAYRGGLIEHVHAVVKKVEAVLALEPDIDPNLTVAGAILHDVGKLKELSSQGGGSTPEGKLVGHLILGVLMVREAAEELGVTDAAWMKDLEHILLSHHGGPYFGSPVRPLTREALVVHFIDNLDSKLKIVQESLTTADAEGFADYNRWMEGRPYIGSLALRQEDEDA
jgi:3'-5' exoribonuclease